VNWKKPSAERILDFRLRQSREDFSYADVGATRTTPPAGWTIDHNRIQLGAGQAVFESACDGLRRWRHFPRPLTEIHPADTPLEVGRTVVILARTFGLWSLNAARIVYVIEEAGPVRRFGFAYGTLSGHAESGEERFLVEWLEDDSVWYDLLAFSKPHSWLARLAYPLTRRVQKRFARESKEAMARLAGALI
jgi:uncharacterized protein (UPF0548 family)